MVRTVRLLLCAVTATAAASVVLPVTPAASLTRPKKEPEAKPRACPEVGEGFVRIPGSDTCIRVGGSVRVEGAAIGR